MTNSAARKLANLRWSRIPKDQRTSPNPAGRPKTLAPCPYYKDGKHQTRKGVCKCGYSNIGVEETK